MGHPEDADTAGVGEWPAAGLTPEGQESDGEVKTARSWMGDWENPLSIGSFHRQENNLFFKKFFIVCQVLC